LLVVDGVEVFEDDFEPPLSPLDEHATARTAIALAATKTTHCLERIGTALAVPVTAGDRRRCGSHGSVSPALDDKQRDGFESPLASAATTARDLDPRRTEGLPPRTKCP